MDLKEKRVRVTPKNVRARLPRLAVNPETGKPMSDWKIRQVFMSRCYDEREDDPWVYMR